jgi:hypothetical protein
MSELAGALAEWSASHVCVRYDSDAGRDRLLHEVALEAVGQGCRLVLLCADHSLDAITERLTVDPWMAASMQRATIELRVAETTYLPDGIFVAERMVALCRDEEARALADGYSGVWIGGDLSWAQGRDDVAEDVLAYEEGINHALPSSTITNLCLYDTRRWTDAELVGILAPHPISVHVH